MKRFIVVKTTVIGEIFQTFDAAKKVADALAEESTTDSRVAVLILRFLTPETRSHGENQQLWFLPGCFSP